MHPIPRINLRTGETEQRPCGTRLEPQYVCHGHGCPCLPLCLHCGTSMDRRGVHSISCPFRIEFTYSQSETIRVRNFNNTIRLYSVTQEIPVIPPAISASPPLIIDGDFEIEDECQCSVCLDECEQSQRVLKPAECDHCFHEKCLIPWISDHSTCPNCRRETQKILRKN